MPPTATSEITLTVTAREGVLLSTLLRRHIGSADRPRPEDVQLIALQRKLDDQLPRLDPRAALNEGVPDASEWGL